MVNTAGGLLALPDEPAPTAPRAGCLATLPHRTVCGKAGHSISSTRSVSYPQHDQRTARRMPCRRRSNTARSRAENGVCAAPAHPLTTPEGLLVAGALSPPGLVAM